jgi:hypothetical protein
MEFDSSYPYSNTFPVVKQVKIDSDGLRDNCPGQPVEWRRFALLIARRDP